MKRNLSDVHPEDTILLAYLDAELPRASMRVTAQHLQVCWKCRAALAEVELRAQAASKLIAHQDESDSARAEIARDKFLKQKSLVEARTRRAVIRFCAFLDPQTSRGGTFWFLEPAMLKTA